MSTVDLGVIGLKTPRIDNECPLEKEFTLLIRMNS